MGRARIVGCDKDFSLNLIRMLPLPSLLVMLSKAIEDGIKWTKARGGAIEEVKIYILDTKAVIRVRVKGLEAKENAE